MGRVLRFLRVAPDPGSQSQGESRWRSRPCAGLQPGILRPVLKTPAAWPWPSGEPCK